jgi:enoyl-CoA hydratase
LDYSQIVVKKEDRIAYIIINRPKVLNALNMKCVKEIKTVMEVFEHDHDVQCVIFTGEGNKAFAAGADIDELEKSNVVDLLQSNGMQETFTYIENYEKPTIAMINGFALGGGCELAMACDIRIASSNAKLGLPELNLSIIPGAGGTQRLSRLVGSGNALYLILTGKMIRAEEAKQWGLVSEVFQEDELQAQVKKIAEAIITKGPLATKLARIAVKNGAEANMNIGLLLEKVSQALLFTTEDKQEGMKAFLEKREAKFIGK